MHGTFAMEHLTSSICFTSMIWITLIMSCNVLGLNDSILCTQSSSVQRLNEQNITTGGENAAVFAVEACSDARLTFTVNSNTQWNTLGITLGSANNTQSKISSCIDSLCIKQNLKSTPNILSCGEFRTFWISWNTTFICAGEGAIKNDNVILCYNIPYRFETNSFRIGTRNGNSGRWIFYREHRSFDIILENFICEDQSTNTASSTTASLTDTTDDVINMATSTTTNISNITMCLCSLNGHRCSYSKLTEDERMQKMSDDIATLKKILQVLPNSTQKYKYTKICAPDKRQTSAVIGWMSAIVVCIPVLLIVGNDTMRLL